MSLGGQTVFPRFAKFPAIGDAAKLEQLVRYEIDISRVINRKLVMAQSDARMYVDDREIYSARDLRVGLFTETGSF